LRNNRLNTSVAAFSTRARPGAPVSTPLAWEELNARLRIPGQFTVLNLERRLRGLRRDPWAAYWKCRQRLPTEMTKRVKDLHS
jgi:bifunctional non-homologous end joining protein LigD